jgi:hypothetical protein
MLFMPHVPIPASCSGLTVVLFAASSCLAAPAFGAAAVPSPFGAGGFGAAATPSCSGLTVVLCCAAFLCLLQRPHLVPPLAPLPSEPAFSDQQQRQQQAHHILV